MLFIRLARQRGPASYAGCCVCRGRLIPGLQFVPFVPRTMSATLGSACHAPRATSVTAAAAAQCSCGLTIVGLRCAFAVQCDLH